MEEGKEAFSKIVAEMETGFAEQMEEIVRDLDNAIQEMALYSETYDIGINNMEGLIAGTDSERQRPINECASMGRAALKAYRREGEQASPSKKFKETGRFDIQGVIQDAESAKDNLARSYQDVAKTALDAMKAVIPDTISAPTHAPEVDCSALMLAAETLEEFQELAAKIVGNF